MTHRERLLARVSRQVTCAWPHRARKARWRASKYTRPRKPPDPPLCAFTPAGHEHAYERIHPVINGTVISRTTNGNQSRATCLLNTASLLVLIATSTPCRRHVSRLRLEAAGQRLVQGGFTRSCRLCWQTSLTKLARCVRNGPAVARVVCSSKGSDQPGAGHGRGRQQLHVRLD